MSSKHSIPILSLYHFLVSCSSYEFYRRRLVKKLSGNGDPVRLGFHGRKNIYFLLTDGERTGINGKNNLMGFPYISYVYS